MKNKSARSHSHSDAVNLCFSSAFFTINYDCAARACIIISGRGLRLRAHRAAYQRFRACKTMRRRAREAQEAEETDQEPRHVFLSGIPRGSTAPHRRTCEDTRAHLRRNVISARINPQWKQMGLLRPRRKFIRFFFAPFRHFLCLPLASSLRQQRSWILNIKHIALPMSSPFDLLFPQMTAEKGGGNDLREKLIKKKL